jgi:phospholipid N-methyltransferase
VEAARFDLDELAGANRLADWMFSQFSHALASPACELGPGVGTFTERLLAAGVEPLLLIEPDPDLAGVLERRFGADPRVTLVRDELPDSPALAERAGQLGFVLCQNVLEHIADDEAALRATAAALRPGGRLALLVPAHPRLYGSLDRTFGHHRRYTRERLRRLFSAAGLELEELRSFNMLGVAGWWTKSRLGATSLGSGSLSLYDAMVPVWSRVEGRLRPPFGLSLIAHGRRPG